PPSAAANPAIALRLQSTRPEGQAAELTSLGIIGARHNFRRQMKMKTSATIVGLLAAVGAFAMPVFPFTSWDDISRKSPDIIIARCTVTTPDGPTGDGMVWSDIE